MSELYKQAIEEAQQLREAARKDAERRIVEKISPYINKMLVKEVDETTNLFIEQEDDQEQQLNDPQQDPVSSTGDDVQDPQQPNDLGSGLDNQQNAAPVDVSGDEENVDATVPDEEGKIVVDFEDLFVDGDESEQQADQGEQVAGDAGDGAEAPVQGSGEDMSMQDVQSMDAQQPDAEEEQPQPTQPQESVENFRTRLLETADRIDHTFYRDYLPEITKENIQNRLFGLLEQVDNLHEKGVISNKQAKNYERKLEFFYKKLKEAESKNSYNKEKDKTMTKLREYAKKLFEEDDNLAQDAYHSGETGVDTDDEYSRHASDVSGVDPNVGGPEDIEATGATKPQNNVAEQAEGEPLSDYGGNKHWDEQEPSTDEEDQPKWASKSENESQVQEASPAPGTQSTPSDDVSESHGGFGDTTENPPVEFEVSDEELAEAVRSIRKENIRKKMKELKEASTGTDEDQNSWEDASPEAGADPSHGNLQEQMGRPQCNYFGEQAEDPASDEDDPYDASAGEENLDLGDMEMGQDEVEGEPVGEPEADLSLNVELPDEVEDELAELGPEAEDQVDVDVDVSSMDVVGDEPGVDMGPDSEGGVEYDENEYEPESPEDEGEGVEDEEILSDEMEEGMSESKKKTVSQQLREAKKRQKVIANKLQEERKQHKNTKKQLEESNLFTSRLVCYSKFLKRALEEGSLNKKHLDKIVEYLDRGKSMNEVKAIYNKINEKINENVAASRKKAGGSASAPTKSGGVHQQQLEESSGKGGSKGSGDLPSATRWQEIAFGSRKPLKS